MDTTKNFGPGFRRWPPEAVEILKASLDRSETSLQTSAVLAAAGFTFSRSAVCGKRARLRLRTGPRGPARDAKAARLRRNAQERARRRARKAAGAPAPAIEIPRAAPASLNVPLWELQETHCRWLTGLRPALYCGAPAQLGQYCAFHHFIMHNEVKEEAIAALSQ